MGGFKARLVSLFLGSFLRQGALLHLVSLHPGTDDIYTAGGNTVLDL